MTTRVNNQNGRFYPEYQIEGGSWVRWPSCFIDDDYISFCTEQLAESFIKDLLSIKPCSSSS